MNFIFRYLIILVAVFAVASCNSFGWMDDKNSAEALQDEIDFAFVNGNCSKVVNLLQAQASAGELSPANVYKYSNAMMCESGMDMMNILDNIFNKDNVSKATSPTQLIQNMMGISKIDNATIGSLTAQYGSVIKQCGISQSNGSSSQDLDVVCGLAAASSTVLIASQIVMAVSNDYAPMDMTEQAVSARLNGKTEAEVTQALDNLETSDPAEYQKLVDNLNNNLNILETSADTMANVMGNKDFSGNFTNFIEEIRPSQSLTNASIAKYLVTIGKDK